MGRFPRYLILLVALFASTSASAAYFRVVGYSGSFGVSKNLVGSDAQSLCQSYATQVGGAYLSVGTLYAISPTSAASGNLCMLNDSRLTPPANRYTVTYSAPSTVACDSGSTQFNLPKTSFTCTCPSGQSWDAPTFSCLANCAVSSGTMSSFTGTSGYATSFCASDRCTYSVKGVVVAVSGSWGGTFASTGVTCSAPVGAPVPATVSSGCVQVTASGVTACIQKSGCGTVNGVAVCAGTLPTDTCVTTSAGATVCGKTAATVSALTPVATPPAPNTGTAGVAATPAATITTEGSGAASGGNPGPSSTSVFTPAQTAASTVSAPAGVVSNTSGTGAPGTADHVIVDSGGSSSSVGTSGNPSVEDCHASGTCSDAVNAGDTSSPTDAKEFSQSLSDFQSAVSASPVVTAFSSVSSAIPTGGTAPSQSFSMLGQSFTFQVPPAVLSAVTDVLSYIMKAVWCLIAIRRFMSA